jgi:hypothetical protein
MILALSNEARRNITFINIFKKITSHFNKGIGLYHPLDGTINLKYKLYFLAPNKISKRKALAFNRDNRGHKGGPTLRRFLHSTDPQVRGVEPRPDGLQDVNQYPLLLLCHS